MHVLVGELAAALAIASGVAAVWMALRRDRGRRRRLHVLAQFLEEQSEQRDWVRRLPSLGRDDIGRAARAVNRLFANLVTLRAELIDHERELAVTHEKLRLREALAMKTGELEARLRERALLFDVLHVSASEKDLSAALKYVAHRLGTDLGLREVGIVLSEGVDTFVLRATYGLEAGPNLLGRRIDPKEGLEGVALRARKPLSIPNVEREPRYRAFWGHAPRVGSFAAFPVQHGGELLGALLVTRPPHDPLGDAEVRLLSAISDPLALAIRQALLVDKLRNLSMHDELTELANRRLLRSRLELDVDRAQRFHHPLSALVIDIDHFKELNDRCGHATGDAALVEVARLLRKHVRRVDTVARLGGEEFVIVLPNATARKARRVAEKLRNAVAETALPGGDAQPLGRLTISVGVAELCLDDSADDLLARADRAMYLAKGLGRNRVAYDREPQDKNRLDIQSATSVRGQA